MTSKEYMRGMLHIEPEIQLKQHLLFKIADTNKLSSEKKMERLSHVQPSMKERMNEYQSLLYQSLTKTPRISSLLFFLKKVLI
jgi:hypothetical protein